MTRTHRVAIIQLLLIIGTIWFLVWIPKRSVPHEDWKVVCARMYWGHNRAWTFLFAPALCNEIL